MLATFARKERESLTEKEGLAWRETFSERGCYCVLVCVLFPAGTMRLNALVSRSVEDMVALIYLCT
jgi:hypothetical protein